ncbi:MAG: ABC transporter permease [Cyclobacteriaceae bacterium]
MKLKDSQIDFIEQDLQERGILFNDLREDLVDHICCEVEQKMEEGMTFMDAYLKAIQPFKKEGLPELNEEATSFLNSITMVRSYINLTIRNILKHKVFSGINILGLSLGMAACFIILQYVNYELSFDQFHPNSSSIFRITNNTVRQGGTSFHTATTFLPVAERAKDEFPEIEDYTRLYFLDRHAVVSYEDRKFEQEAVLYADANFFQFFSYGLIKGNEEEVLQAANTVALSESAVLKYFDDHDPIGKLINLSEEFNDLTLMVTGVFKDPPGNSHLKPQMVVSMSSYENQPDVKENEWNWPFYMNYIRLQRGSNPNDLEKKFPEFVAKYSPQRDESIHELYLQPLEDIHLHSNLEYEIEPNGNAKLVFLLLGVAILTLVIAYANYINLSTARSLDRAKEVGIRKALGSKRLGLIKQFLTEAIAVNIMALLLAIVLVKMFMLFLFRYGGITIDLTHYGGFMFWGGLGIVFLMGAVLSSLYPAFVLSSFQPIAVLRGKLNYNLSGHFLRKLLVLFQFTTSISLMIAAYAIYSQIQFMRNQPLGMDIQNLLVVKGPRVNNIEHSGMPQDPFILKSTESGAAIHGSVSSSVPGIWTSRISNIVRQGSDEGKNNSFNVMGVDHHFMETYQLNLLAGRNFQPSIDTSAFSVVIINESAVGQLGFSSPEEAVNARIAFRGRPIDIIGVINDYHHYSLKAAIDPLLLYPIGDGSKEYYTLRTRQSVGQLEQSLSDIESQWRLVYPDNPFEYFFLDSSFDAQYKADLQFERIFTAFSLLAVFIACLGLYGLASFVTMKRTKEIGIRKVLGSSVKAIVVLLLSDFSKLILIAGLVAIPIAYVGVENWQSQFAFKDQIAWWMYLLPIAIVLFIAIITISIETIKVALINPVKVLKYD